MANSLFSSFTIASILVVLLSISPATGDDVFGARVDRKLLGLKKEKLSHFKFYWHDILSGPTPTSMRVISPPSNESTTLFGLVNMIDNPLTLGPKLSSKVVGKAQGLYASASQKDLGLLMIMNFAFTEGKYNGSTLAVLGRNEVMSKVREMPVIGGSGLFRFSRGYVQAKTHTVEWTTGDAIVEYNVYVLHY